MEKFKDYMTYILTTDDDNNIKPTKIHILTEYMDEYITKNLLSISPKFYTYEEMDEWNTIENVAKATNIIMNNLTGDNGFRNLLMKSDYIYMSSTKNFENVIFLKEYLKEMEDVLC